MHDNKLQSIPMIHVDSIKSSRIDNIVQGRYIFKVSCKSTEGETIRVSWME